MEYYNITRYHSLFIIVDTITIVYYKYEILKFTVIFKKDDCKRLIFINVPYIYY